MKSMIEFFFWSDEKKMLFGNEFKVALNNECLQLYRKEPNLHFQAWWRICYDVG